MNRREVVSRALGFSLASSPLAAAAQRVGAGAPLAFDIQKLLDDAVESGDVPGGSIALLLDGQLSSASAGVCNVETGVPVTDETLHILGSVTKVINATLVMQLVDEGLVDLDTLVTEYVPELRLGDPSALKALTVRMLLNHTSGIDGETLPDQGPDLERIEDAIGRFGELSQLFAPGMALSYSNAGAVIAGYLCQVVKGESWYTLVKKQIFDRLELEHSITYPTDTLLHRAAVGHYKNPAGEFSRVQTPYLQLSYAPAGSAIMMCAKDLATFTRAHMQDGIGDNGARILTSESAQLMRKESAQYSVSSLYSSAGLGWLIEPPDIINHSGGGSGIFCQVMGHVPTATAVVVSVNTARSGLPGKLTGPFMTHFGVRTWGARFRELFEKAHDASVTNTDDYVGIYKNIVLTLDVREANGNLEVLRRHRNDSEWVRSRLRPIEGKPGMFVAVPEEQGSISGIWSFVNPSKSGSAQHMANAMRLLRRID